LLFNVVITHRDYFFVECVLAGNERENRDYRIAIACVTR
jgi:hypothetical protein